MARFSLLDLASYIDEMADEVTGLTEAINHSLCKDASLNERVRASQMDRALDHLQSRVSQLLDILPGPVSASTDAKVLTATLVAMWLDRMAEQRQRSKQGLHGTTDSIDIASVLQFVASGKKTGELRVESVAESFALEFVQGNIVDGTSTSSPRGERLGEILVELGHVEKVDLDRLIEKNRGGAKPLGILVLDAGLVGASGLRDALETQVRRLLQRLTQCGPAFFEFRAADAAANAPKVKLATLPLLLKISAESDETRAEKAGSS